MIADNILLFEKDAIPNAAMALTADDIRQLVALLSEKDDKLRYPALLLLQCRSQSFDDVYPYFNTFAEKLRSDNSYQRGIGMMLMAQNAQWDVDNKFDAALDDYLSGAEDEKPITARQCIQALDHVIPHKAGLLGRIADRLIRVNIDAIKPSMKKLLLLDILHALMQIRKLKPSGDIDAYIFDALSGGILDDKSKKQIVKML